MRQIGKLPSRNSAQVLTDYLLTQGISTKLEESASAQEGEPAWILWGVNEDQIDKSREIYREFIANPDDPRFREARGSAKNLRKQEQAEKTRRERQMFDANRLWSTPRLRDIPVIASCIAISVVLSFATGFGHSRLSLLDEVYYRPQTVQDMGFHLGEGEEFEDEYLSDENVNLWLQQQDVPKSLKERLRFAQHAPRTRPDNPDIAILKGQVWRLVTPIFLHLGGAHLLFNMMWFYSLGGVIEMRRGSLKILGMILYIAVISNFVQAHTSPNLFGGMSGVVYGLFVYLWLGGVVAPGTGMGVSQQQVVLMMLWLVLGFNMPAMHMANMAHLAGALSGASLAMVAGGIRAYRRKNENRWV